MSKVFQCPKCGGQDLYKGNKTILGGIGGIYGNRSKDVLRNFCRKCDIEALPLVAQPSAELTKNTYKAFSLMGLGFIPILVLSVLQIYDMNWILFAGLAVTLGGLIMLIVGAVKEKRSKSN